MNIAFDIDGVLTDFEWFLDTYGKKYFRKKTKREVQTVKPSSSVSERFGFSKEWDKKFYTRYLFWYARKYPIRENAAETIRTLRLQGHKVYFITARALADGEGVLGHTMRVCLEKWLKDNRVEYDGIYYVPLEECAYYKAKWCKKLKIDVFIEDEPTNIKQLEKLCRVICVSADYNQEITECVQAIDFGEIYWNIINDKRKAFKPLEYKERDELNPAEKTEYYERLKNYYSKLPFDKVSLVLRKKNIEKSIQRVGAPIRWMAGMEKMETKISVPCDGVIFVCNHRRAWDVPICYCALNEIKARILTKREFEDSVLGSWMKSLGIIFLNREDKKSGKAAQNLMIQSVLHGENVLLYPEGTRNKTSEPLLPFKMGAVYMAQVTQAPIIPLVIYKKDKKYRIVVGEKMMVKVSDDLEMQNSILHQKMEKMLLDVGK